jgi:hypothetical protein
VDRDNDRPCQQPVPIKTVGDLAGTRTELFAYCNACRHSAQLDLEALCVEYGRRLSLPRMRSRLRCSRCGTRCPEIMHVWKG